MLKIATLRNENNITQAKLANELGIARSTLAMYETNKSEPDLETLIRIADYFEVTTDYLLGHETILSSSEQEKTTKIQESKFAMTYGHLFNDENFNRYTKIYNILNSDQQKMLLGYVLGFAEQCGISYKDIG